jgi:cytochrome c2
MLKSIKFVLPLAALFSLAAVTLTVRALAADKDDGPIKQVMKTYHKAPKGVDPVCKKASDGKASAAEIKNLVAAYKTLATTRPPQGDDASWKEKTSALLAATEAMQKGSPDGVARYKEAVNCKACHSVHKPN